MKDDDEKYLDPEKNPAIATDDEDPKGGSEDRKTGLEGGLPFTMTEKINVADLADKIKILYPNQKEIAVSETFALVIQNDGVDICKRSTSGTGWDYSPLKDGSEEEIAIVKRFVDDKQK